MILLRRLYVIIPGSHTLTLQANHYETYTETFTVNSDYKTKVIDMTAPVAAQTSRHRLFPQ